MKLKQQMNRAHPSIKLDFNFSHKDIDFLDNVYKTHSDKQEKVRLFRICSTNNEFQDSYDKLRNNLIKKLYKKQEINEGIERTKTLDRQKILEKKTKKRNNRIPLILTHNRILPQIIQRKESNN